jgi:FeS assembly SUF system protein
MSTLDAQRREAIAAGVVDALKTVYDPEIPVDIYELGLVYGVDVREDGQVEITMTLTSPLCPVAGSLPFEVKQAAERVDGVAEAHVELTFDPPWTKDRMSEVARLELGLL